MSLRTDGAGPRRSARLDELQDLGAEATCPTLAIQSLKNQTSRVSEVAGIGTFSGLPVTILGPMKEVKPL